MAILKQLLPYHHDSALLFQRIAHEPWAMLLDSGQAIDANTNKSGSHYGQYDIIVARPIITLVTNADITTIQQGQLTETSDEDPFAIHENS